MKKVTGFRLQLTVIFALFLFLYPVTYILSTTHAIVDPLAVPNNKFGIHIIQATPDESSPAAQMVNNNGDWGYITVLIESKDRNHNKWQEFFNDLRRRHLIPIIRLATQPVNEHWTRRYEGEEQAWSDFLDNLNWPTKNRYVIIYNEPNHGKEWGNFVDPKLYAETLDKTITALKNKNRDFFVLNAGFDASAPYEPPEYFDETSFLKEMEKTVPGVLNKLDGWVSHSYPNPGFVGSPNALGRGTVRTWIWELQLLRSLGVTKDLPVFITETGWKHAEGLKLDASLPTAEVVANHYKIAFENAFSSDRIVAVTPFLLTYQDNLFDHFSFKKVNIENQPLQYYPQYQTLHDLPKVSGQPVQENKAQLIKGEVYSSIVAGEKYTIPLTFKNTGQSIWDETIKLVPIQGGTELGIETARLPKGIKIEPGQEHIFQINLKAPKSGSFKISLNLYTKDKQFDSPPVEFNTEVKSPVILVVKANLKWKKISAGKYTLKVAGVIGENQQPISIDYNGSSNQIEARYLLPDYTFEFSLAKPFYKSAAIKQQVSAGINILDFGKLEPDIISALLHPKELWQLLPFSN